MDFKGHFSKLGFTAAWFHFTFRFEKDGEKTWICHKPKVLQRVSVILGNSSRNLKVPIFSSSCLATRTRDRTMHFTTIMGVMKARTKPRRTHNNRWLLSWFVRVVNTEGRLEWNLIFRSWTLSCWHFGLRKQTLRRISMARDGYWTLRRVI